MIVDFMEDFMEYAGYRSTVVEEKIDECLEAARNGVSGVSFDREDLTDDEIEYIKEEVRRRLNAGY